MVYTVRLKKVRVLHILSLLREPVLILAPSHSSPLQFKHLREITAARKRLEKEYSMEENADVLFGRADALYAQYRWSECWAITSK